MFFQILLPFVTFEYLDSDWTTELILEFDEKDMAPVPTILDQMMDLGYKGSSSILLLGSLFIFLLFYAIMLVVMLAFWVYVKNTGKHKKVFYKIHRQMFFS